MQFKSLLYMFAKAAAMVQEPAGHTSEKAEHEAWDHKALPNHHGDLGHAAPIWYMCKALWLADSVMHQNNLQALASTACKIAKAAGSGTV